MATKKQTTKPLEMPQSGGSYVRNTDGSLSSAESPTVAPTEEPVSNDQQE